MSRLKTQHVESVVCHVPVIIIIIIHSLRQRWFDEEAGLENPSTDEILSSVCVCVCADHVLSLEAALSAFSSRDGRDCLRRSALSLAVFMSFQNF